jgi:Ca-activated chloride channel family protein
MSMFKRIVLAALTAALVWPAVARAAADPDGLYRKGRYAEAEEAYSRASLDHPRDLRYRYNRGCAAFQKGDYAQATAAFTSVLRRTQDDWMRFRAAYNLGNAAFKQNDLASAQAAYAQALRLNPDSREARHNLEMTLRAMKKSEQQAKSGQQPQNKEGQGQSPGQSQAQGSEEKSSEKSSGQKGGAGQESPDQSSAPPEKQGQENADQPSGRPADRTGNLEGPAVAPQEGADRPASGRAGVPIDRQKAEALLDNIREDPARFMKYRIPEGKRRAGRSGKDW